MTHSPLTRKALPIAVAGIALAALLVGCSPSTPSGGSSSGAADSSGVDHAKAQLATYSKLGDGFVPSEPLTNASSLSGKTIVYIPAVAAIPFFATSYTALKAAFKVVGADVQICDAQASPAPTAACLQQAINIKAAGVIMDALPPVIAQEAYDAVVKAGIPVVLGNIPVPQGSPATVQTVGPDMNLTTALAADAIIAASKGTANVLAVRVIDSPVTSGWMDNGATPEFTKYCPGCKVTIIDTKTTDLQNLPSKVSAGLLANADASYLFPQLSPEITPTVQGATDAGKGTLTAASTATTLGDLQQLKAGPNLTTSVGWDVVRTGWIEADLLMRLIVGQKVDASKYVIPSRVFTKANTGDFELTQDAWDSSAWFGGTDYQKTLTGLWTK